MEQRFTTETVMAKNYGSQVYYWRKNLLFSSLIISLFSCSAKKDSSEWIETTSIDLQPLYIAATEVTNAQFKAFVDAANYKTSAEVNNYGGAIYEGDEWRIDQNANWKHPMGKASTIQNKMNHPVVQVSYNDALAYCRWAKVRLPTEDEWEYVCLKGKTSQTKININHGQTKDEIDGYLYTSPVKKFPSNALGIHGMLGNVWEITASQFESSEESNSVVMKGGSFLCDAIYCQGYKPEARQSIAKTDAYFHVGFRVVRE